MHLSFSTLHLQYIKSPIFVYFARTFYDFVYELYITLKVMINNEFKVKSIMNILFFLMTIIISHSKKKKKK
jgi:hypothetical protein